VTVTPGVCAGHLRQNRPPVQIRSPTTPLDRLQKRQDAGSIPAASTPSQSPAPAQVRGSHDDFARLALEARPR
jgi:hypothetical protein